MNKLNEDEFFEILIRLPLKEILKLPRVNHRLLSLCRSNGIKQLIRNKRNTILINQITKCYRKNPCLFMGQCIESTGLNNVLENILLNEIYKIVKIYPKFIDAIGEHYYDQSERELLSDECGLDDKLREKILTSVDQFEFGTAVLKCLDPITLHIILYRTDSVLTVKCFISILTEVLNRDSTVLNDLYLHVKKLEKMYEEHHKIRERYQKRFDHQSDCCIT